MPENLDHDASPDTAKPDFNHAASGSEKPPEAPQPKLEIRPPSPSPGLGGNAPARPSYTTPDGSPPKNTQAEIDRRAIVAARAEKTTQDLAKIDGQSKDRSHLRDEFDRARQR